MVAAPTSSAHTLLHGLAVTAALALMIVLYAAAWLGVAGWFAGFHGWMALLAAPTILASLRWMNIPAGALRCAVATLASAAAIALANWLVIALPIADATGLTPWATALRIGPHFAWTLVDLSHGWLDWLWTVLSLGFAAWAGYSDGVFSARRRPTP